MGDLHSVSGGDLISASMSGNMGVSSEAIEELNRRAGVGQGDQPQNPPIPIGPVPPLSQRAQRIVNVLLIGGFIAIMWLAFRSAIAQAMQGQRGALGLLIGTIVTLTCLVIIGTVFVALWRFLMAHKILAIGLLCAGGYWAYLAFSHTNPKPNPPPAYAPAAAIRAVATRRHPPPPGVAEPD